MNATSSSPKPPVRRSVKLLALLVVSLIFLILAELITRLFAPHPRYAYYMVPDAAMGVKYQPNHKGRATNIFGEFDTLIEINQEGFRDVDHPLVKPAGVFRIAILGDSFTAAEQVEEPDCFVRRTETLLNQRLQSHGIHSLRVEILNFGVGGHELQQYALNYEAHVRKYKPDLVLIASFIHNDLLGNAFYLDDHPFGRPYYKLDQGQLQKVPADLEKLNANYEILKKRLSVSWYHHFQLYNAQKQIFWAFRQNSRLESRKSETLSRDQLWKKAGNSLFRYYAFDGQDPYVKEADELSRLLLQKLEADVRRDGATFKLVMLPAKENLFPEKWPEALKELPGLENIPMNFERPYQKIKEALPEMAARGELLDLRPALKKAAETQPVFFPRDSHFNKQGHEASAQAIAQWLQSTVVPFQHSKNPL